MERLRVWPRPRRRLPWRQPLSFRDRPLLDDRRNGRNVRCASVSFDATVRFPVGEVYVNSLDEGEEHRIHEAYGPNWEQLRSIKRCSDPTNFFRCNQNIPPAG